MLCVISVPCTVEAQAYGANDRNQTRYAYVKLKGVAVFQASWFGEFSRYRGVNVVVVNPADCTMQSRRNFDTHAVGSPASRLRNYIQGLSDGTVLVGVSCDEPTKELDPAEATLTALGADVSDVRWRGAFAFVAEIGDPSKTVLDKELTQAMSNARQPKVNVSFGGA